MTGEWIGLIGGLAGTVLGWMLGILSQKGRLHIFSEWSDRFQQDDAVGGIIYSTTRDNAKYYRYSLVLDLYNASGEPKVMRKIEIVFYKGRRELFRLVPKDDSTKRYIILFLMTKNTYRNIKNYGMKRFMCFRFMRMYTQT